eukprot:5334362-Amphidinium_carterae.2
MGQERDCCETGHPKHMLPAGAHCNSAIGYQYGVKLCAGVQVPHVALMCTLQCRPARQIANCADILAVFARTEFAERAACSSCSILPQRF